MFIKPLRDDHAVLKGVFTMKDIDLTDFKWTREPERYQIQNGCIAVTTKPHTDLWQRTYYHFRNDNAPVFQMETDASLKTMWYRFSRRGDDYCIECSPDGTRFSQMRICHMLQGAGAIQFGIYACSPEDSSFTAFLQI